MYFSKTCTAPIVRGSITSDFNCVYCAAAGTIFGTTYMCLNSVFLIFLLVSLLSNRHIDFCSWLESRSRKIRAKRRGFCFERCSKNFRGYQLKDQPNEEKDFNFDSKLCTMGLQWPDYTIKSGWQKHCSKFTNKSGKDTKGEHFL